MKTYNYKISKLNILLFFLSISFVTQLNAQSIGFTLVDASTNTDIQQLVDYSIINPSQYPNINIVATTTADVGSIVFYVEGNQFSIESVAPYTLAGDNAGNFNTWDPTSTSTANPIIKAELYSGAGGTGTLVSSRSIILNIVDEPAPSSLTITNCPTNTVYVGDVIEFDVLLSDNLVNRNVAFNSSGDGRSFNDITGKFTAITPGEYTVYATSYEDGSLFDSCTFTVSERSIAFNNCPTAPLEVGETLDLDVTFFGDFTNTNLAFYSSDSRTISYSDGVFSADTPGEYVITVGSFEDGSLSDTCTITVNEPSSLSITNCPTAPLEIGDVVDLDVTFFGNPTNTNVTFYGSDINADGIFTARSSGEYVITARNSGGAGEDTCTITVNDTPRLTITNCPNTSIEIGEEVDLDVIILGNPTSTFYSFTYVPSSGVYNSGNNVGFYDGVFSASDPGEYTVYVTSYGGATGDSCTITVIDPNAPSITGFTLVDADTGDYFDEIVNPLYGGNSFINPFQPTNLNVVANTTGDVGSIVFYVNGNKFSTESVAPYALAGDNAGNFNTWDVSSFTDSSNIIITGELYSEAGGNGTLLSTKSVLLGTVTNRPDYIYPLGLTFDCPTEPIEVGETIDVGITLLPTNALEKSIKFPTVPGADVSIIGIESFTFRADEPGVYVVGGMSYGNGSIYKTCTITVVDSTSSKSANESKVSYDLETKIYPNPVVDVLTVQLNTIDAYNIILFDLSGTKLLETSGVNNYESLDLSNFESGVYIIQIEQNGTVFRNKILKK